jgi:multicomponent K+:H+ antiporter subunit D
LATLAAGTLGALASTELKRLVTYLVVASVGTQLSAVGLFTEQGLAAAIFYIIHSTFLTAALFLMAGAIIHQRGALGGRLSAGPVMYQGRTLGLLFLVGAMSAAGLPPLSGFVSKALILAATPAALQAPVWAVILGTSFLLLVLLARVGSVLFWNLAGENPPQGPRPGPNASLMPAIALLAASVLMAVFAGPIDEFSRRTAAQLYDRDGMIQRVMGDRTPTPKTQDDMPPGPHGFVRRPGQEGPP